MPTENKELESLLDAIDVSRTNAYAVLSDVPSEWFLYTAQLEEILKIVADIIGATYKDKPDVE